MISIGALRGYVFEEVLAKLLQGSGYDLLVEARQDPDMLVTGPNGLRIHGRGSDHQADVLGELRIKPTFTYPLRLFVEAKYRRRAVGLPEVRNAVGVINDVNEFYTGEHASRGCGAATIGTCCSPHPGLPTTPNDTPSPNVFP